MPTLPLCVTLLTFSAKNPTPHYQPETRFVHKYFNLFLPQRVYVMLQAWRALALVTLLPKLNTLRDVLQALRQNIISLERRFRSDIYDAVKFLTSQKKEVS